MSDIKERIMEAVTVMSDNDAQKVWKLIQATFALANAEPTEPTDEERRVLLAYYNGVPDYSPVISHENLLKELGL